MISTNDMRPGQSILVNDELYLILEYQHVKPGKGKAFVKTKIKNIINGSVVEKTFRADEQIEQAYIEKHKYQYLYKDGSDYVFMSNESYEQINIDDDLIDDKYLLMKANQEVTIQTYNNKAIDVSLPTSVELLVTKAEEAVKGDSVNSSNKYVECETGLRILVPMFIEIDEIIKIDTKNKEYITRVKWKILDL